MSKERSSLEAGPHLPCHLKTPNIPQLLPKSILTPANKKRESLGIAWKLPLGTSRNSSSISLGHRG